MTPLNVCVMLLMCRLRHFAAFCVCVCVGGVPHLFLAPLVAWLHVFPPPCWLALSLSAQVNIEFLMPASACLPWCVGRCFVCHTHVHAHAWGLAGAAGSTGTQGQVRVSFGGLTRRSLCCCQFASPTCRYSGAALYLPPPLPPTHTHSASQVVCVCSWACVCNSVVAPALSTESGG